MKQLNFKKIFLILIILSLFLPTLVLAADFEDWSGLKDTAGNVGYTEGEENPAVVIGRIIQYVLSLVGVIFLIIIIISYLKFSQAGGDEEEVRKGKEWLKNGIWGIFIVLAAYAITVLAVFFVKSDIFK